MTSAFASCLLEWYRKNRRILPWREDPTPYHVFLSEFMLQQTRVDTVLSYYERFLDSYPSFEALSRAKEEDVMLLWQGLGYYSRARNLLKAAKMVVDDYGGSLPSEEKELKKLPGVGDYMAKAIRGIALGLPSVAVDGNLLRVYARLNALPIDVDVPSSKKACEEYFGSRMENPSAFNQALMDLGELVCMPSGMPKCGGCPFENLCKSRAEGTQLSYPLPKKKPVLQHIRLAVLLVFDGKSIAIRKRSDKGLLASLYEFPNLEGTWDENILQEAVPTLRNVRQAGICKHRFSHIEWTMDVFLCGGTIEDTLIVPVADIGEKYSMPTAFRKTMKYL